MTTAAYTRDVVVLPVLRAVRTCAAEQFALAGRLPCRFPITWNTGLPPADACACTCDSSGHGQAWARWVSTKPADLGKGGKGPCADGTYEFTIQLGVYRCWPVPGEGKPLDEGEEELAALGMLLDAAALRRALLCCDELKEYQWELTQEEPAAHQGGCTGVTAQARVIASDCECGSFSSAPQSMRQRAGRLSQPERSTGWVQQTGEVA